MTFNCTNLQISSLFNLLCGEKDGWATLEWGESMRAYMPVIADKGEKVDLTEKKTL